MKNLVTIIALILTTACAENQTTGGGDAPVEPGSGSPSQDTSDTTTGSEEDADPGQDTSTSDTPETDVVDEEDCDDSFVFAMRTIHIALFSISLFFRAVDSILV